MKPFKRNQKPDTANTVFTGRVRFVAGKKIKEGTIFGRPFKENLLGPPTYYVEADDRVYQVPGTAIEQLKEQRA